MEKKSCTFHHQKDWYSDKQNVTKEKNIKPRRHFVIIIALSHLFDEIMVSFITIFLVAFMIINNQRGFKRSFIRKQLMNMISQLMIKPRPIPIYASYVFNRRQIGSFDIVINISYDAVVDVFFFTSSPSPPPPRSRKTR